jgi:hypothetical protein
MWGQGLLDHAPVPKVEVLPIREDLGMWEQLHCWNLAPLMEPNPPHQGRGLAPLLEPQPGAQVGPSSASWESQSPKMAMAGMGRKLLIFGGFRDPLPSVRGWGGPGPHFSHTSRFHLVPVPD